MIPIDSDARLEYTFEWVAEMLSDSDTIASKLITVRPSGLTADNDTIVDGNNVVVWVSGGERGRVYEVTCLITTSEARKYSKYEFFAVGDT
jgi:hypothetical protein